MDMVLHELSILAQAVAIVVLATGQRRRRRL
jgi:hypothetical protein